MFSFFRRKSRQVDDGFTMVAPGVYEMSDKAYKAMEKRARRRRLDTTEYISDEPLKGSGVDDAPFFPGHVQREIEALVAAEVHSLPEHVLQAIKPFVVELS